MDNFDTFLMKDKGMNIINCKSKKNWIGTSNLKTLLTKALRLVLVKTQ